MVITKVKNVPGFSKVTEIIRTDKEADENNLEASLRGLFFMAQLKAIVKRNREEGRLQTSNDLRAGHWFLKKK